MLVQPRAHARTGAPPDSASATISGFVKDSASGETIIGATVRVRTLKIGAITNTSGFFSLHLPGGEPVLVEVASLGYRTYSERVTLRAGEQRRQTILLAPMSLHNEDITVETDAERRRQEPQVSRVDIKPQQVQELPKAGEADLFRILQFLPGVQHRAKFQRPLYPRRLARPESDPARRQCALQSVALLRILLDVQSRRDQRCRIDQRRISGGVWRQTFGGA